MTTCIYDNPVTERREYWNNKKLTGWYTAEFLNQSDNILPNLKPTARLHICRFFPGRIIGDSNAIKQEKSKVDLS